MSLISGGGEVGKEGVGDTLDGTDGGVVDSCGRFMEGILTEDDSRGTGLDG